MSSMRFLAAIYGKMEEICRARGMIAGKSGRHMVFPYTISAKIAQFPIFYYMKNNWVWMYYPLGIIVSFVFVFSKIHGVVNSPEYKKTWAETQKQMAEKEHGH